MDREDLLENSRLFKYKKGCVSMCIFLNVYCFIVLKLMILKEILYLKLVLENMLF